MSTNIECFDEDKELGEKETQPQTSTHKKEAAEITLTEEHKSEDMQKSEEEYIPADIIDTNAVAEEEKRIFKSHIREETKHSEWR